MDYDIFGFSWHNDQLVCFNISPFQHDVTSSKEYITFSRVERLFPIKHSLKIL